MGVFTVAVDVTNLRELEKTIEIERTRATQSAKLALLGEMSAGIAHEINNPLAIVSGLVNQLERFSGDPVKLKEKIEAIKKSCFRITKIVSGLKKFSRTESASNYEKHKLSDILREAITLTQSRADKFGTQLSCIINSEDRIFCDDIEIEQVLVNLINNAVDAVKLNIEKWVKVSVFREGSFVVIRVLDSGLGIPGPVQDKIFQPFFTTKPVGEGTGLGLSVTKGILDAHNATIQVVPHLNTCFEVRFHILSPEVGSDHAA